MDFLPEIEKREQMVSALALLISQTAADPFSTGPLILPVETYFPDTWTPDGKGVWHLSERTMAYAGLSNLASVIRVVRAEEMPSETVLATFDGISDETCRFCVRLDIVDDPTGLAAALAHESAHAYRAHRGLVTDGPDEELLTDLTMVFLGFGVLGLNAAYRFTVAGKMVGGYAMTEYAHKTQGYLAMEDFAYLLAVQTVVRALDREAIAAVEKHLGANQKAAYRKARKTLRGKRDALRARLGISRTVGIGGYRFSPLTRVFEPARHLLYDAAQEDTSVPRSTVNSGLPVFRVARHPGWLWAVVGAGAAFGGIVLFWDLIEPLLSGPSSLAVIAAAALFFYQIGRGRPIDCCSEPECETRLPPDATVCPGCGGTVTGRLKRASDRLEAREALEDRRLGNLLKRNKNREE